MWCMVSDMLVLWNKIGKRALQSLDIFGVLTFSIFFRKYLEYSAYIVQHF